MKRIIIDKQYNAVRLALLQDSEMIEYYVERNNSEKMVGNIYKGKVVKIHPAMEIAFVKIKEEKNAFLFIGDTIDDTSPLDGVAQGIKRPSKFSLREGDIIMCQVVKDEFGNKGARITLDITLPGRLLVMMPKTDYIGISSKITNEDNKTRLLEIMNKIRLDNYGYIIRTAAENASEEALISEIKMLNSKWQEIDRRYSTAEVCSVVHWEDDLVIRSVRDMLTDDVNSIEVNDKSLYERIISCSFINKKLVILKDNVIDLMVSNNLNDQIDRLTKRKVVMKNGSSIIIDRVEALTVIDVNTGKYVGDKNDNLESTVFNTNMLAAEEIAKQLRLRNIGGIIIVDFIDMELIEHREEVLKHFNEHLKKDRIKTTLVGMTNLGLVELTRKKIRSSISAYMLKECPYCSGDGYVLSDEYTINKIKEALREIVDKIKPRKISVTVNCDVYNTIFSLNYFLEEIHTVWNGIKLYIVADDALHREKYIINIEQDLELSINARLIS